MICKMAALVAAVALSLGFAGSSFAAKLKCTVDTVEEDKVTMTCEKADKMTAGDKVKITLPKKAAIEGC